MSPTPMATWPTLYHTSAISLSCAIEIAPDFLRLRKQYGQKRPELLFYFKLVIEIAQYLKSVLKSTIEAAESHVILLGIEAA